MLGNQPELDINTI